MQRIGFLGLCRGRRRSKPKSHDNQSFIGGIKTIDIDCNNICSDNNNNNNINNNSDVCICIITWNMNGQVSYQDLEELVGSNNREFDILVVGLQEAPRSNISRLLQSALVESHILLEKATMQSLQLYVFIPKNSNSFIKEVKVDKHAIGGWGGLIRRKKGAVAIFLNYKAIRMVFITCHLSAHTHKVEERNWECKHISHSLFSKQWNPYARSAHITVWLGDLNYRIHGITTHPARNLIHKHLHTEKLTVKDQLLREAERKGHIFNGYCEGTLSFKPTYKYNVGTSNYDTSYKVRVPAWTDRILFKIEEMNSEISASLRSYESMDEINSSDHKPVKAHLNLTLINSSSHFDTSSFHQ